MGMYLSSLYTVTRRAVHFNFGLHDIKHIHPDTGSSSSNPAHPRQAGIEVYGVALTSSSYRSILVYGVFIAILLWRPQGLLSGRKAA